jgi:hypothetical protein
MSFFSTNYTGNSLEYFIAKILHAISSALSFGVRCVNGYVAEQFQAVKSNEVATDCGKIAEIEYGTCSSRKHTKNSV